MSRAAASHLPAESDWLCEGCGYVLNGLPTGGNCPECGKPTRESANELRVLPLWEQQDTGNAFRRFVATSADVIFRPTRFYRSFATRGSRRQSARFAHVHWLLASVLFALAAWVHADWFLGMSRTLRMGAYVPWYAIIPLTLTTYVVLVMTTRIAARLTTWEATYRGLRLPLNAVLRGLDYHAAHYLPVSVIAVITVIGYRIALGYSSLMITWGTTYLYTLCIEVVLGALYLFKTYWIGMRNMMYASR
jgi:hypothetical protein